MEESGNELGSGLCLQDLEGSAECIRGRMAGTGNHAVGISHLDHHDAVIKIFMEENVCCFFFVMPFFFL